MPAGQGPVDGAAVRVAIRPERLTVAAGSAGGEPEGATLLTATVRARSYVGARYNYDLDVCGETLKVESLQRFDDPALSVCIPVEACIVFGNREDELAPSA